MCIVGEITNNGIMKCNVGENTHNDKKHGLSSNYTTPASIVFTAFSPDN